MQTPTPLISDMGRAMMAEQSRNPNPQQQLSPAQNSGLVSLDSLLRMQAQINYLKNAMPQKQQPQGTVAQDMMQQIQQAQGMASLQNPNVGSEHAYAMGGIVAFDSGGSVQHFDGLSGSEVGSNPNWTDSDEQVLSDVKGKLKEALSEKYALGPYGGVSYADPELKAVQQELKSKLSLLEARKEAAQQSSRLGGYRSKYGLSAAPAASAPSNAPAAGVASVAPAGLSAEELVRVTNPSVGGRGGGGYRATSVQGFNKSILDEIERAQQERDRLAPKDLAAYKEDIRKSRGPSTYLDEYKKGVEESEAAGKKAVEELRTNAKNAAWAKGLQAVSRPGQAGTGFNQLLSALGDMGAKYEEAIPGIKAKEADLRKQILADKLNIAKAAREDDVELDRDARAELQRHTEMYTNLNNNIRSLVIGEASNNRALAVSENQHAAAMAREDNRNRLQNAIDTATILANTTKDPVKAQQYRELAEGLKSGSPVWERVALTGEIAGQRDVAAKSKSILDEIKQLGISSDPKTQARISGLMRQLEDLRGGGSTGQVPSDVAAIVDMYRKK